MSTSGTFHHEILTRQSHTFRIIDLPFEIRSQIFSEVLQPFTPSALNLLAVNKQFHHEARTLIFHSVPFTFPTYYSSSLFSCRPFLQRLAPWQLQAIRKMQLQVTESDLGGFGFSKSWWDICDLLAQVAGSGNGGVRHLRLDICLSFMAAFEAARGLFRADASWVVDALVKIRSLRSLEIVIDRVVPGLALPGEENLGAFEERLRELMPWCADLTLENRNKGVPRAREKSCTGKSFGDAKHAEYTLDLCGPREQREPETMAAQHLPLIF